MNSSKLCFVLFLLFLLAFPLTLAARNFELNPYGAFITGWVENHQANCQSSPCEYVQYSQGDQNGSGSLTPFANSSTSVAGALSQSYVDVPGNRLWITANSDIPYPYDGNLYNSGASASAVMWDTVSFAGAAAGQAGTMTFTAEIANNSKSGLGTVMIEAASTNPNGWQIYQDMYSITGGMSGTVTLTLAIPLDAGPFQFVALANLSSSTGVGANVYSADISLDPGWSFSLPSGVTLTSSGGAEYPIDLPTPEPGTLSALTLGVAALGGLKRKFLK